MEIPTLDYGCALCRKIERVNKVTGESNVKPREIWRRQYFLRGRDFAEPVHSSSMILAHEECAEQWEVMCELRDVLNNRDLHWHDKQNQICRLLTKMTDLMNLLPQAISPDWRPEFVLPEDYYNV